MSKRMHAATHPLVYRSYALAHEGGRTPWASYASVANARDGRDRLGVYAELADATAHIDEMATMTPYCVVCESAISRERADDARARGQEPTYCSDRCRSTAAKRRQRAS